MKPLDLKNVIHTDSAFIRTLADCLRSVIEDTVRAGVTEILIDCAGIRFASRAFAHELLCIVHEYSRKNIEIKFVNLENEVDAMLAKVENGFSSSGVEKPIRPELYPRRITFEQAQDLI